MNIIKTLETRYSTKEFDPNKSFTKTDIDNLESLLQLSPSSTNVQPWHFVVATTEEGKKRVAKAAEGFFSFNQPKVLEASAVVVFAGINHIDEEYLLKVLASEDADGRFAQEQWKNDTHMGRSTFVDFHKYDFKDAQHWAEKQLYLNLGNFLLGAAALGFDALPMEGLDMKALDAEFGLREKGYSSAIVVAVGYHKESDFNKDLPKSRLPKEVIIDRV